MPNVKENNLVWIDLEMSGLNPEVDFILEFSGLVTNPELEILDSVVNYSVHQPEIVLSHMDGWNTETHTRTGLIERCRQSPFTIGQIEERAIESFSKHCEAGFSPLCGNSVGTDKNFIRKYMPRLFDFLHYRIIDVSTVKELASRWQPDLKFTKREIHSASMDILESINELKFYRKHFFRI